MLIQAGATATGKKKLPLMSFCQYMEHFACNHFILLFMLYLQLKNLIQDIFGRIFENIRG